MPANGQLLCPFSPPKSSVGTTVVVYRLLIKRASLTTSSIVLASAEFERDRFPPGPRALVLRLRQTPPSISYAAGPTASLPLLLLLGHQQRLPVSPPSLREVLSHPLTARPRPAAPSSAVFKRAVGRFLTSFLVPFVGSLACRSLRYCPHCPGPCRQLPPHPTLSQRHHHILFRRQRT
jgi:hypothetical protein